MSSLIVRRSWSGRQVYVVMKLFRLGVSAWRLQRGYTDEARHPEGTRRAQASRRRATLHG